MVDVVADEQSITLLSRHIFTGDILESYVFYMFIDKDQAIMSVFLLFVLIVFVCLRACALDIIIVCLLFSNVFAAVFCMLAACGVLAEGQRRSAGALDKTLSYVRQTYMVRSTHTCTYMYICVYIYIYNV